MKEITLFFLMLLTYCSLYAQNTSSKDAREIKKRTLIVGLEELDPKSVKKLDETKLAHVKAQIEGTNYALKTAVEKYWNYSTDIKYMPVSEATELLKKNPNEYAALLLYKYVDYSSSKVGSGWVHDNSIPSMRGTPTPLRYNPGTRYTEAANEIIFLSIYMPKRILSINLPNLYVSLPDAVYGIMQMQYILNRLYEDEKLSTYDVSFECNGKYLKERTLLLCNDDLDKKLNDNAVKEIYPFDFKIVTAAEIDSAILNKDANSVIVQIVSAAGGKGKVNIHFLSDTQTGRIIGFITPNVGVGIGTTKLITYNEKIKEKHLKGYLKIANCN